MNTSIIARDGGATTWGHLTAGVGGRGHAGARSFREVSKGSVISGIIFLALAIGMAAWVLV